MSLWRLPLAIALATSVALTAHLAGFGTSHALGGTRGAELAEAALTALALLFVAGVLFIAFATSRRLTRDEAVRSLTSTLPGGFASQVAVLAFGGSIVFGGLELLEGHAPLGSGWALLLLPLAALAVALAARFAIERIAALGLKLAALAGDVSIATSRLTILVASNASPVPATVARGVRFGRAPPRQA